MLKGHVFQNQTFGNQIFALFIDTFLDGHNGIVNGYKNSMSLTTSGSSITIGSGAVCVQGRFLEENSSTTIDAGTNTAFCKLVLTIDLDRENTALNFTQGFYEVVTSASDYPSLTQNNIVGTNEGKYQYELAQFKTGLNGISDFVDKRTFLDFNSIYAEIESKIEEIEEGSIYALKEDVEEEFANLITVPIGGGLDYFGTTAPNNFLFADGSAVSRTEYSELFAVIGTRYGSGNGSTTFNLPDKRERVSVGYKAGSTNGMGTLGATGGEFKHALTSGENGQHSHSFAGSGSGSISDVYPSGLVSVNADYGTQRESVYNSNSTASRGIAISISGTTGASGNGTPHNNLQPYLVCNYIIRVK